MDETHFVYDLGNRNVLAKKGEEVTYKDIVSGSQAMTLVLCITGGASSQFFSPFFIIQNDMGSYPIGRVPDNILECSYWTQNNGWMNRRVFNERLAKPRAFSSAPEGHSLHLYCDNAFGHSKRGEVI